MSYDLFITPDAHERDVIADWFASRRNYQVSGDQIWYANDDTGVSFGFAFAEAGAPPQLRLVFSLSYCRPHVFGLEAEPEVAAFLARFNSRIEGPQAEGMGEGPYSREGFLRSWNAGNRLGFEAAGRTTTPPPPWPAEPGLLEAIWRWNFGRERLQQEVGDRQFVPKLRWAMHKDNAPVACATWTEGVPTLIPEELVTHVLMVRQPRPSFKRLLGAITGTAGAAVELKLVTLDAVRADPDVSRGTVDGYPVLHAPQSGAIITPGSWPRADIRILPPEEVCGADLVALLQPR